MLWVRFALLVCVASILQAGFLFNLNLQVNLLLILLVFFAIYYNASEAIVTSFVIGFIADIANLSGTSMGQQMISFGLAGTALTYLHQVIAIRRKPYQAVTICCVVFITIILTGTLNILKRQPVPEGLIISAFWPALFSGIVGPFLFAPFAWWMHTTTFRYRKR